MCGSTDYWIWYKSPPYILSPLVLQMTEDVDNDFCRRGTKFELDGDTFQRNESLISQLDIG